MFVYGDIVKAPKHKYIVVSVDDSKPKEIQYGLIRDTKANRDSVTLHPVNKLRIVPEYWYNANVLEFVEQA